MTPDSITWRDAKGEPVAARIIAWRGLADGGTRAILRSTADELYLAELHAGAIALIVGPVTLQDALDAAQVELLGETSGHGSVHGAALRVALGLCALALDPEAAP